MNITIIAFGFIIAIILIKYKPIYKVSMSGEKIGYIKNKEAFEENIKEKILTESDKNVDNIDLEVVPEYELKLVDRTLKTNEQEVEIAMKEKMNITYKYYEVLVGNEAIDLVDTKEEAELLIAKVKEEKGEEIELSIVEKYTNNKEEVKTTDNVEVAKEHIEVAIDKKVEQKREEERIAAMPQINGVRLAYQPVTGTITSRYGENSRIRSSSHTGLDIAAPTGTPIKAVSSGVVKSATREGAYGNMVKIDHGNGVETWYAHTSKMYVKRGQTIAAGEVIAAVGSTGNSTGPHLHLEIRLNGVYINPQQYLYK